MTRSLWSLMLLLTSGCGAQKGVNQDLKYDSATSEVYVFTIEEGRVRATSGSARTTVFRQLQFAVGQLNGIGASPELAQAEITILRQNSAWIDYRAQFNVGWNRRYAVPDRYRFYLPADVSDYGLQSFHGRNARSCAVEESQPGNFWYYYRPMLFDCPVRQNDDAVPLVGTTSRHPLNTENRIPEYDRVLADGALRVVAAFGRYGNSSPDLGMEAYERFKDKLIRSLGPVSEQTSTWYGDRLVWVNRSHQTVVDAFRFGVSESNTSNSTKREFGRLARDADLIAYNGHSGLGGSIGSYLQYLQIKRGQYQIVYLNGCDTFAYMDPAYLDRHQSINQQKWSKNLDVIANNMPSYFASMGGTTANLVIALQNQRQTWREILATFDDRQAAVVTGEEDNPVRQEL